MGVAKDLVLEFVESMQKAKSPAPTRRIIPKKWRKSKTVSSGAKHESIWKPEGGCVWSCKNGRHLTLNPVTLLTLTELERLTLQKIVQAKVQGLDLGCTVPIPKDWNNNKRSKKSTFSSLRKRTASTGALENIKGKDGKETGLVFGVPLGKCIVNETELRRRKPQQLQERRESLDIPAQHPRHTRKSSSSSGAISSDSLSESDSRNQGHNLLEALSLSSSANLEQGSLGSESSQLVAHLPQIPYVVSTCCKHLETYGLRVLGIFRIGSSKKRSKQLREELDTGRDVKLNEEHNPHDVAALFKEYFRDLPDPLLTRDLYSAFVATRKIKSEEHRLKALRLLIALLPVPNRDTLWALLHFLDIVGQHSADVIDENGQVLSGNKMDTTNLATLFGPNILHKAKGGEFQVESLERAEERKDVIGVIKELIDHHATMFKLPPKLQDELYRVLLESKPAAVDHLLKKRALSVHVSETEHETSTSSFYDESECSSIPHSPGYLSETDSGYPRTFAEAMQMGAIPQVVAPSGTQMKLRPHEGQSAMYHSSPLPTSPQKSHKPASRANSDDSHWNNRSETTLKVPVSYRLSAPEQPGWYHSDRSMSPASPRINPSPKTMKADTPELRIRVTKSNSPDRTLQGNTKVLHSPQVRRSVGVPHGPGLGGPGGHRSKSTSRNMLTVPVPCSRSKSSESCSSIGSSSGYHAGSSRSGTSSPMTPDHSSSGQKWYLESPPDSPNDGSDSSQFHRTSSTHRPLGFNVPKTASISSSSSSSSTVKTGSSPYSSMQRDTTAYSSMQSGGPALHSGSSGHLSGGPTFYMGESPPHSVGSSHQQTVPSPTDESMDWQKERWKHWEKLAKQHSEEFHEQETLV